jgi:hypothetical protein
MNKSLPLDGGGQGGGDKNDMESTFILFTLPFISSRQGRGIEVLDRLKMLKR